MSVDGKDRLGVGARVFKEWRIVVTLALAEKERRCRRAPDMRRSPTCSVAAVCILLLDNMKTRTSLVRIAGVVGTLLIFSAASLSAQPKPLDCKSPRTKVARAACASEELQKLDQRIETAYLDLLKLTPSPAAEARERFEWLRQLDSCNKAKDDQVVACARSALA